jgi:glycosyltransferase involved in cell wall biosynthesis
MGWAACVLSKFKKVPFTYEIQDMWPETLRATGMLNNEWALDLIGQFGKWVYSKASAIRVISPGFRDNLIQKGVDAGKIHVISNWVDTNFFRPLEPDSSVATQYGLENRFNILYAGTIGFAQGLETVINAAELLRDVPKIQFVLVGDGADFQRLKKLTEKKALKNVKFLGRHPVDQMPVFYALADVLFLHLKDDPLFRITIPHKIFTYLASGRPILAAVHGDAAQVVGESDSGVICPPDNAPALADAVRKLYQLPAEERIEMGINARRAAIEQYSREILISRINHMIAEIVHSKNRH